MRMERTAGEALGARVRAAADRITRAIGGTAPEPPLAGAG